MLSTGMLAVTLMGVASPAEAQPGSRICVYKNGVIEVAGSSTGGARGNCIERYTNEPQAVRTCEGYASRRYGRSFDICDEMKRYKIYSIDEIDDIAEGF